ncbi:hypothetical protein [Amycolatopsis sp. cmx-8-4]|uniref:hypothetical protein n=1 Tax=Amycolatopsis sp. cmx-8-4 TaxID=2790947 RepID=UPI003979B90C
MTTRKYLMRYPEERVLEDAAFGHGLTPARVFAVLLPVWQVEVRATTTDGRPYALIDRYLERGIAEAGLGTVGELAAFLALDEALVDRALRVLGRLGHIRTRDGRIELTELGTRSHRDQVCYIVEREDRRKLYFDGFRSFPLSRAHYDAGVVTFLSPQDIPAATSGDRNRIFKMLHTTRGFRREALMELAGRPDRDYFNLPLRIDRPESLGEECVYLPTFIVRALEPGGRVRHLVYSQASDAADPDLGELCETTPEISFVLESDAAASSAARAETRITEWLRRMSLEDCRPVRSAHGAWRVVVPAKSFEPQGRVPLHKLGSFVVSGTDLLHIWCTDRKTRERALLERVDLFLGRRTRSGADKVKNQAARMVRQLELGAVGLPEIRDLAVGAGFRDLAARLGEVLNSGVSEI